MENKQDINAASGSLDRLVRLRWRNEKPDVSGYWLRFDNGALHGDYVTEKDLKVESEQPGYLGEGVWCGPIEQPNMRTEVLRDSNRS